MVGTTDQELLELIQNPFTKERGYRMLVETYQRRVYGIIRKMVIVHEDADDLTQNTFIKAFKNLDKFQGNSSLFTWLYRIATNESLNFLEKKKKRFFFSIEDHHQVMSTYLESSPDISGSEVEKKLQKSLLGLPEKQRLVFNLKYFEDMSYEEMSQVTDTSVGALKASYHHAVKKIEQDLTTE
ncbi:sigma-70 family RNA polymerase sigma factor [Litoribacter alkaliphilus]|uniref:RNA polymerase sigma factor n=1 Tax=Litoribacter ruber TaxID=702568 RepID=A0AAP2CIU3_9BACT|nr:sigma-70 family RNA polymerase sigma factor [Litoribacter alkaliphilus]MBS9524665.1 sigma-70 family RNA polymerase sigma factor [Litoribacter alkaliphilus]